jgi:hypothetical protein
MYHQILSINSSDQQVFAMKNNNLQEIESLYFSYALYGCW